MNSKVHEGHTTQSAKHPSSASRKTQPQASSRTRDENIDPRQRRDQQDAPAEEIDIEDVDPLYKWMRGIGKLLLWVLRFIFLLLLILCVCLYSTVKIGGKYGWHILKELIKLIQEQTQGEEPQEEGTRGQGSSNVGPSNRNATSQPTRNVEIPTSGAAATRRLLHCNRDNPFEVLGVSAEASVEDIKKYYRKQCVLVHPDKNDHPRAQEAFQILQKGYDTLIDPVKRREFEMEKRNHNVNFSEEMEDFVKKMEEVLNTLSCDACGGKHRRYDTDKPHYSARYCSRHNDRHPAYEGDMWAESSHFGFKVHYYAMMEDRIFDITEWAACQKANGNMGYIEANGCEIRYRLGSRNQRSASRPRNQQSNTNHHSHQRSQDYEPDMSEEMLREIFERLHRNDFDGSDRHYNGGGDRSQDRSKRHKKHRKKKR